MSSHPQSQSIGQSSDKKKRQIVDVGGSNNDYTHTYTSNHQTTTHNYYGDNGRNGSSTVTVIEGPQGRDGRDGRDGIPGMPGIPGAKGDTGPGIIL